MSHIEVQTESENVSYENEGDEHVINIGVCSWVAHCICGNLGYNLTSISFILVGEILKVNVMVVVGQYYQMVINMMVNIEKDDVMGSGSMCLQMVHVIMDSTVVVSNRKLCNFLNKMFGWNDIA